ncbi:hypothetical protein KBD45_06335, partial [Candidatus Dojkabacteria bacterium]|nr:hypothetical protein [Candidatus Dojkabacteria bacterium]
AYLQFSANLFYIKPLGFCRLKSGGGKGEGDLRMLGFVRSATPWLRLTPYGRKLQLTPLRGVR